MRTLNVKIGELGIGQKGGGEIFLINWNSVVCLGCVATVVGNLHFPKSSLFFGIVFIFFFGKDETINHCLGSLKKNINHPAD